MFWDNCVVKTGELAAKPGAEQIDRALRNLAQQQMAFEADEAHWLRIAEEQKAWPKLGYVHALEYLEEVFGYAPRTAMEHLRVARELGDLPQLEDALRVGEMSYSAVRELTRVATPETVELWIESARGRRFRDVEQMVSGRSKGDKPGAPPDPALVKHRLVLELDGESLAIWRQMKQVLELELEHHLDDRNLVVLVGERILRECTVETPDVETELMDELDDAPSAEVRSPPTNEVDDALSANVQNAPTNKLDPALAVDVEHSSSAKRLSTRLRYMIHIITCRDCGRVSQDGGGVRFDVNRSVLERAECDAFICDDEHGKPAKRTIPTATERLVLERAHHRCQVPGCRSSKHLTIHHIVFRSLGGTNDPSNLIVLCDGHHRLLHDGLLTITGRAPDDVVIKRNGIRLLTGMPELDPRMMNVPPLESRRTAHAVRKHASDDDKARPRRAPAPSPEMSMVESGDTVTLARAALCQLGFKADTAAQAVKAAQAGVGADVTLEALIKEALRCTNQCQRTL